MPATNACTHHVIPSCCPRFQPKKRKPYYIIVEAFTASGRECSGGKRAFMSQPPAAAYFSIFLRGSLCSALMPFEQSGVWMSGRAQALLPASERGGNKARQDFRWQPAWGWGEEQAEGLAIWRDCGLQASCWSINSCQCYPNSTLHSKWRCHGDRRECQSCPLICLFFPEAAVLSPELSSGNPVCPKDRCICMRCKPKRYLCVWLACAMSGWGKGAGGWRHVGLGVSMHPLPCTFLCGCCSVTQLCLTLCNPMDCSTLGSPVLHHILELARTHVHWVGDAIQPSHPPLSPSPPFPALGSFPVWQTLEMLAASVSRLFEDQVFLGWVFWRWLDRRECWLILSVLNPTWRQEAREACWFLLPPQQGSQAAHISSGLGWVLLLLMCHVQNVEGF